MVVKIAFEREEQKALDCSGKRWFLLSSRSINAVIDLSRLDHELKT